MNNFIKYYNLNAGKHNARMKVYFDTLLKLPESEQNIILDMIKTLCDNIPSMGKLSALELIGDLGTFLCAH